MFGLVRAVIEATFEQLDCNNSEDELKQHVDDHDIEDVFERVDNTVEHRLATRSNTQPTSVRVVQH